MPYLYQPILRHTGGQPFGRASPSGQLFGDFRGHFPDSCIRAATKNPTISTATASPSDPCGLLGLFSVSGCRSRNRTSAFKASAGAD